MVVDAVFVKAKTKSESEQDEANIVVSMLGKKAVQLIADIRTQFLATFNAQDVALSSDLIAKTTQVLISAISRYNRVVRGQEERPTAVWLHRYLSKEVLAGTYKASDQKDLVWAVYSYFL